MCATTEQDCSGNCNQEVRHAPAGSTLGGFFRSMSGNSSVFHDMHRLHSSHNHPLSPVLASVTKKHRGSYPHRASLSFSPTATRLLEVRNSSTARIPCRGRSVIDASGTTGGPSTRRNRNCWASVARISAVSISATVLPMHWRGPPPNGKYAKRGRRFSRSPSHRSGRNSSGASYHLRSRCTVHCAKETPEPWGTE